ncbi:hypothetical protein J6590_072543 [Homalodisca vitripennis]|nr:hypothetical protein J6590_072543 [Homalodisca vitripennis]
MANVRKNPVFFKIFIIISFILTVYTVDTLLVYSRKKGSRHIRSKNNESAATFSPATPQDSLQYLPELQTAISDYITPQGCINHLSGLLSPGEASPCHPSSIIAHSGLNDCSSPSIALLQLQYLPVRKQPLAITLHRKAAPTTCPDCYPQERPRLVIHHQSSHTPGLMFGALRLLPSFSCSTYQYEKRH